MYQQKSGSVQAIVALALVVLGLVISGYLLFRHLVLAPLATAEGIDVCSALFGTGCDAALRSPVSEQFGLLLAGWGIVYYVSLAACLLLAWLLGEAFALEAAIAAFVLSLVAGLGSVILAVLVIAGQAPFCPLCAVVHLINLLLVFSFKRLTGLSVSQWFQVVSAGVAYLFTGRTGNPAQARWKLLGFIAVTLVSVVIYQRVLIEARLQNQKFSANPAFDPYQIFAAFKHSAVQNLPLDANDPALGPTDAPVQLVVFSDFQCLGCKDLSQQLADLSKKLSGKLRIVFKHFPFGIACNASIKKDLHPHACEAARAAEAARRQGKFWVFHDALFAAQLNSDNDIFRAIAGKVGLDLGQFETDFNGEATRTKVQSDIELAQRLGVDATPTVFLNGRYVAALQPQALELLITYEFQHANGN